MTLDELKRVLDHGDYVKIARLAGYEDLEKGRKYVYKVLAGRIKGFSGISKKILEAAEIIAKRNIENGKTKKTGSGK